MTRPDWLALSRGDLVADPLERAILAAMVWYGANRVWDAENIEAELRRRNVPFAEEAVLCALNRMEDRGWIDWDDWDSKSACCGWRLRE